MRRIMLLAFGIMMVLIVGGIFSTTSTLITIYNTIVESKAITEQKLADLAAAYQRRYALIDNLIVLVKETKTFESYQIEIERTIYKEVATAKAGASKFDLKLPAAVSDRINKEENLSNILVQALDKLFVLAPHYPQITDPLIKDHLATFTQLTALKSSLQQLEDGILESRQDLNNSIRTYNQRIKYFPANLLAGGWGFMPLQGFQVSDEKAVDDVQIAF